MFVLSTVMRMVDRTQCLSGISNWFRFKADDSMGATPTLHGQPSIHLRYVVFPHHRGCSFCLEQGFELLSDS